MATRCKCTLSRQGLGVYPDCIIYVISDYITDNVICSYIKVTLPASPSNPQHHLEPPSSRRHTPDITCWSCKYLSWTSLCTTWRQDMDWACLSVLDPPPSRRHTPDITCWSCKHSSWTSLCTTWRQMIWTGPFYLCWTLHHQGDTPLTSPADVVSTSLGLVCALRGDRWHGLGVSVLDPPPSYRTWTASPHTFTKHWHWNDLKNIINDAMVYDMGRN